MKRPLAVISIFQWLVLFIVKCFTSLEDNLEDIETCHIKHLCKRLATCHGVSIEPLQSWLKLISHYWVMFNCKRFAITIATIWGRKDDIIIRVSLDTHHSSRFIKSVMSRYYRKPCNWVHIFTCHSLLSGFVLRVILKSVLWSLGDY